VFFDNVGGQRVYTNATYQSILGLSPDEAMGAEWMKVLHPDDSDWVLASVQAAHSRQRAFELVHRYLRADGRVVWASVKGAPVRVDDEVLGYVGTVEDITARVNAEEALKRRSAQLEAANQELEAFSYSVSHDLRAPVRAIGGFSRLLLQRHAEGLHPEAVHYLERVHHGAQHMGQLIDDLLAFARLGRQALRIQRLTTDDLAGLVNRSVADLRAEFPDRSVEVIIHDLPPCHADVALLKQVLINLLSNAFKFTQSRPIARIEVGSAPLFDGWAYSIRDNGVGFDMRYAHKLFNVFQRLHRSEEFEGTGVGLAIVQRIIHKHGGRIWAEAEVDKGAAIYFTLGKAAG
jgi:PAS domain S-box-containing protein